MTTINHEKAFFQYVQEKFAPLKFVHIETVSGESDTDVDLTENSATFTNEQEEKLKEYGIDARRTLFEALYSETVKDILNKFLKAVKENIECSVNEMHTIHFAQKPSSETIAYLVENYISKTCGITDENVSLITNMSVGYKFENHDGFKADDADLNYFDTLPVNRCGSYKGIDVYVNMLEEYNANELLILADTGVKPQITIWAPQIKYNSTENVQASKEYLIEFKVPVKITLINFKSAQLSINPNEELY